MRVRFLDQRGNRVLVEADMISLEKNAVVIRKVGLPSFVSKDEDLVDRYNSKIKANMYDECIDFSDFTFGRSTAF